MCNHFLKGFDFYRNLMVHFAPSFQGLELLLLVYGLVTDTELHATMQVCGKKVLGVHLDIRSR